MPVNHAHNIHPLIRRLESMVSLSPEEMEALIRLPLLIREVPADHDIVREGDRATESCLVLKGMAFRYKLIATGKRQIMSFHIAGEVPDLQSLHLNTMDHGLAALTLCRLAFIAHETLKALFEEHPRLASIF